MILSINDCMYLLISLNCQIMALLCAIMILASNQCGGCHFFSLQTDRSICWNEYDSAIWCKSRMGLLQMESFISVLQKSYSKIFKEFSWALFLGSTRNVCLGSLEISKGAVLSKRLFMAASRPLTFQKVDVLKIPCVHSFSIPVKQLVVGLRSYARVSLEIFPKFLECILSMSHTLNLRSSNEWKLNIDYRKQLVIANTFGSGFKWDLMEFCWFK